MLPLPANSIPQTLTDLRLEEPENRREGTCYLNFCIPNTSHMDLFKKCVSDLPSRRSAQGWLRGGAACVCGCMDGRMFTRDWHPRVKVLQHPTGNSTTHLALVFGTAYIASPRGRVRSAEGLECRCKHGPPLGDRLLTRSSPAPVRPNLAFPSLSRDPDCCSPGRGLKETKRGGASCVPGQGEGTATPPQAGSAVAHLGGVSAGGPLGAAGILVPVAVLSLLFE